MDIGNDDYWNELREIEHKIKDTEDVNPKSVYNFAYNLSKKYRIPFDDCHKHCITYCEEKGIKIKPDLPETIATLLWSAVWLVFPFIYHFILWMIIIKVVFDLLGLKYTDWNYLIPFEIMADGKNMAMLYVITLFVAILIIVLCAIFGKSVLDQLVLFEMFAPMIAVYLAIWMIAVRLGLMFIGITFKGWELPVLLVTLTITVIIHLFIYSALSLKNKDKNETVDILGGTSGRTILWTISNVPYTSTKTYELKDDTGIIGTLKWKKFNGWLAEIIVGSKTYTVDCKGIFYRIMTMKLTGSDKSLVEFRPNLGGGGTVEFADGRRFQPRCVSYFGIEWEYVNEEKKPLFTYKPMKGFEGWHPEQVEVKLTNFADQISDAPLLALLWWYTLHLTPDILAPRE